MNEDLFRAMCAWMAKSGNPLPGLGHSGCRHYFYWGMEFSKVRVRLIFSEHGTVEVLFGHPNDIVRPVAVETAEALIALLEQL